MTTRKTVPNALACLGGAILLGVGASNVLVAEAEAAAGGTDAMIEMAMGNMHRIMMMPEADRMSYVMNAQQETIAHGRALFEDNSLGTNGQACASCHVGGRTTGGQVEMMPGMNMPIPDLYGVAATFPKFKPGNDAVITLSDMNNNCLVMFQQGTPLALDSPESRDLAAYVTTLAADQ